MIPLLLRRPALVFALDCLTALTVGWTALLAPGYAREIVSTFTQSDAGLGLFYLLSALGYVGGSLFAGWLTERLGRRVVFVVAAALHGAGVLAGGLVPTWELFVLGGIVRSVGGGALDGGMNGLALDLYPGSRGRALNILHLFFAAGALSGPFAFAWLRGGGIPWTSVLAWSGLASLLLVALFAIADLADGRRRPEPGVDRAIDEQTTRRTGRGGRLTLPVAALGVAISGYVGVEMGVSNWIVRFLSSADAALANGALGLYWAGLAAGRLIGIPIGDRFDHLRLAIASTLGCSITILAAVLVPWLPASIGLFALAGVFSGPIFPLVMAVGGERFPDRSAAMSGTLAAAAFTGSLAYPPLMGLISVTVGLPAAMAGTGVLAQIGRAHV